MQGAPLKFDPSWGHAKPYPTSAAQYRHYRPDSVWIFNPWTGGRRHPDDMKSDPFGQLIVVVGDPFQVAQ